MAESKPSGPAAYVSRITAKMMVRTLARTLYLYPAMPMRSGGNNRERSMLLVRGPDGDFNVLT